MNLDGLSSDNFRKLSFDERTIFSEKQKNKFNPNILLEKGKKFGLGLDRLHKVGLDGNGVNIAIIDWTFDYRNVEMLDDEGKNKVIAYDDSAVIKKYRNDDGFHGKTVSSLLVGNTVGVAPGSKLF